MQNLKSCQVDPAHKHPSPRKMPCTVLELIRGVEVFRDVTEQGFDFDFSTAEGASRAECFHRICTEPDWEKNNPEDYELLKSCEPLRINYEKAKADGLQPYFIVKALGASREWWSSDDLPAMSDDELKERFNFQEPCMGGLIKQAADILGIRFKLCRASDKLDVTEEVVAITTVVFTVLQCLVDRRLGLGFGLENIQQAVEKFKDDGHQSNLRQAFEKYKDVGVFPDAAQRRTLKKLYDTVDANRRAKHMPNRGQQRHLNECYEALAIMGQTYWAGQRFVGHEHDMTEMDYLQLRGARMAPFLGAKVTYVGY